MPKTKDEWPPQCDSKIIKIEGESIHGGRFSVSYDLKKIFEHAELIQIYAVKPGPEFKINEVKTNVEAYVLANLESRMKALCDDLYWDAINQIVDPFWATIGVVPDPVLSVTEALQASAYVKEYKRTRRKPPKGRRRNFDLNEFLTRIIRAMFDLDKKGIKITMNTVAEFGFEGLSEDGFKYYLKEHDITFTQIKRLFQKEVEMKFHLLPKSSK